MPLNHCANGAFGTSRNVPLTAKVPQERPYWALSVITSASLSAFRPPFGHEARAKVSELALNPSSDLIHGHVELGRDVIADGIGPLEVTLDEGAGKAAHLRGRTLAIQQALDREREPIIDGIARSIWATGRGTLTGCKPVGINRQGTSQRL
jgi:hypothetical protein